MRAVLPVTEAREIAELASFVESVSAFTVHGEWDAFELQSADGEGILSCDLWIGEDAAEDLTEPLEEIGELSGRQSAKRRVRDAIDGAAAVVGLQIVMSRYDESVDAANTVIAFLEQPGGVLTQVDTVGWYDGSKQILNDRR